MLKLHVSRDSVEVTSKAGTTSTKAVVALSTSNSKDRPVVVAVGDTRDDLARTIDGLNLPVRPRLVDPGADPWWDAQWRWPQPPPVEGPMPEENSQVLVLWPLHEDTWSPVMAHALLRYVLFRASGSGWRAVLPHPTVQVAIDDDFDDTEYAELVDVLREVCGPLHVHLPPERKVGLARTDVLGMTIKGISWLGLSLVLVLPHLGLSPRLALGTLCGLAAILLIVVRVAKKERKTALRVAKRRTGG